MKVKVVRSFSDTNHGTHAEGDVIDLPPGVDWLRAGFVEVIAEAVEVPGEAQKPVGKKAKNK